ncbi:unnamed protein product [Vicia faba]|uniref:Uncharacterized protein n=1 Tax=Vicia faba TaxID=3906 RepID=A0AAV1B6U1_VICFA|nr:unnamed protein product [Vicia faba]
MGKGRGKSGRPRKTVPPPPASPDPLITKSNESDSSQQGNPATVQLVEPQGEAVQHWIPKPPDEMQASTLPSTSVGMGPAGSQSENTSQASGKKDPDGRVTGMQDSSEDAWKEAPRSVTVKGKHHGSAASSGIFKAILQQRALVPDLTGLWGSMLNEGKFYTNKVYNELISDRDKVIWCNLILRNKA